MTDDDDILTASQTDEVEVHTPSLEAAKWWPGGLGHTANHALVFARLISRGKVRRALVR